MKYTCSNGQIKIAEQAAFQSGTPASVLMERAGEALAGAVLNAMEELGICDALFVCGGGNNGGDGFAAARILHGQGKDVEVLCMAERFSELCKEQKARFSGEILGRPPRRAYRLVVDCLFGTGLSRAPQGNEQMLIEFINCSGAYVIACDLPSGLAEGGVAFPACVRANRTVCMGQYKNALFLSDGADVAGELLLADIGLPQTQAVELWEEEDAGEYFPKRKSNTNKSSYGSACIFAGGTYSGAAFLSAGACLKSGAGYTRLCVTEELYPYAVGKLPACILRAFKAIDGEILGTDCIALGMGTGVSEWLFAHLQELFEAYTGVLVLDADALNTLAAYGVETLKTKSCQVVITPHPKEFSRLTGKSVKEILSDPVAHATAFAREYGVVVVLKNNRSVITDGERTAINLTGSPALAKGGSGDVLSGFLAGTIARGVSPYEAACVAAYVLGKVGELVAERFGEYAPDASDVLSAIPEILKKLAKY